MSALIPPSLPAAGGSPLVPDASPPVRHPSPSQPAGADAKLRRAAEAFEAAFLAEMLRHTGLGRMPASFNGGFGEAAFAGTLVEEYAKAIARAGGLGLADRIYKSLAGKVGP